MRAVNAFLAGFALVVPPVALLREMVFGVVLGDLELSALPFASAFEAGDFFDDLGGVPLSFTPVLGVFGVFAGGRPRPLRLTLTVTFLRETRDTFLLTTAAAP